MCMIWKFAWGLRSTLGGPLNFAVRSFPEEVLKLLANFLIVILTFSEMGIRLCRRTCWMYPHKLASSVASNILRGLRSCHRRLIIWPLIWRRYFWEILLVPQFPVMTGDPNFLEELLCSVLGNVLPAFFVSWRIIYWWADWLSQRLPIFLGVLQSSWKECSTTVSEVPGSLQLPFCFPRLMMEKLSMGCFPYLWRSFWFSHIYQCSARRRI